MRIISGARRGQKLIEFDGMNIRPTTDRVRESLFNLIQDYIYGSAVLDLFAGSGALSFEALSRGARSAELCDISAESVRVIEENRTRLRFEAEAAVSRCSAEDYIKRATKTFDIIFLDPPYNKGFIVPIIAEITRRGLLAEGGIIVLESDSVDDHGEMEGLEMLKQRKYGRTYVTIYQRGDSL